MHLSVCSLPPGQLACLRNREQALCLLLSLNIKVSREFQGPDGPCSLRLSTTRLMERPVYFFGSSCCWTMSPSSGKGHFVFSRISFSRCSLGTRFTVRFSKK